MIPSSPVRLPLVNSPDDCDLPPGSALGIIRRRVGLVLAAGLLHYVVRYRLLEGFDGFVGKRIAGWVGAWVGSPVLGHWFEKVKLANIYLIPALIGAFCRCLYRRLQRESTRKGFRHA